MTTSVPSIFDYKVSPERLAKLGHVIVTYAHLTSFIENIYMQMGPSVEASTKHRLESQLVFIRNQIKEGNYPEIAELFKELRWALRKIQFPRNMLAHGILLYSENGEISLWSQQQLKELSLDSLLELESHFNYALWVATFIEWTLKGIQPHKALPSRPS